MAISLPSGGGDVRTLSPLRHRRPCAVGLGRFPARRPCSERGHIAAQPWGHRNRATEGGRALHQLASLGGQRGVGGLGAGQGPRRKQEGEVEVTLPLCALSRHHFEADKL